MSLDPTPSDAELLRIAEARQARARRVRPKTDCGEAIDRTAARVLVPRKPYIRSEVRLEELHITIQAGRLLGCTGIIVGAPRTKKNSKAHYTRQSPGYRHWRNGVVAALRHKPTFPLVDQPYNLEAHFYVDQKGVPADLLGLLQGFADALENAGVVTDDQWFRGLDGSRKHDSEQARARVEFAITPLADPLGKNLSELREKDAPKWGDKQNPDKTYNVSIDSPAFDRLIEAQRAGGHATISDTIVHMYTHVKFPEPPPKTGADDQC